MSYKLFYKKLHYLWTPLRIPDEGLKLVVTAKSSDKTRQFVEDAFHNQKTVYQSKAKNWAYALAQHCNDTSSPACKWLMERSESHQASNNSNSIIPFGHDKHTYQEIIEMLYDMSFHKSNQNSYGKKAEALTWSEFAWYYILRDSYSFQHFEYLFQFSSELPTGTYGQYNTDMNILNETPEVTSNLDMVKQRWTPKFESNPLTIDKMVGKYFLYRVSNTDFSLEQKESSKYGWFGDQKVQVVPVEITEKDKCLKYSDYYPDPIRFIYQSVGIFSEQQNGTFEIIGIDKEANSWNNFFGRLSSLRADNTARGSIYAISRYPGKKASKIIEAYPFWLKQVEEPIYYKLLDQAVELSEFFKDNAYTLAEKQEKIMNDQSVMVDVGALLEQHDYKLIHYLFSPKNLGIDDLRSTEVVNKITPDMVRQNMEIPWR